MQQTNENIKIKEDLLKGLELKGYEDKRYSHETVLNVMEEYVSQIKPTVSDIEGGKIQEGKEFSCLIEIITSVSHKATSSFGGELDYNIIPQKDFTKLAAAILSGYQHRPKQGYTQEQWDECRNKLYENMPTGEIKAWDLINVIQEHLKYMDEQHPSGGAAESGQKQ